MKNINDKYSFNKSIYIFKKKGKYFLFEINKLAIFELSKLYFNILKVKVNNIRIINRYSKKNKVLESNFYKNLLKWGIINKENSKIILKKYDNSDDIKNDEKNYFINGIYLVISQKCNLKCKYCSAGYGSFGKKENDGLMNEIIAKKSIDFMIKNLPADFNKPLIALIGGEPLLNFKLIKYIYKYIDANTSIHPNYLFNTNGTLLNDEMAKWFVDKKIPIRFSIDGTKKIHDSNRIYPNGRGSYNMVKKGISTYLKYYKNGFSVQSSIPQGKDIVKAIHHIWKLGSNFVLANITAESPHLNTPQFYSTKKDWNRYYKGLEKLDSEIISNFILKGQSKLIHNTFKFLRTLHRREKIIGCGVCKVISVDINGNIYPCSGFLGLDNYIIGNVYDGFDKIKLESFYNLYIKYLEKCNSCWAKNICGGSCIALSILYNEMDDKYAPSRWCYLSKKTIENSIYFYNIIKDKKPNLFVELFGN